METNIIASEKYFDGVENNYINGLNSVSEYIENHEKASFVHVKPVMYTETDSQAVSVVNPPAAPGCLSVMCHLVNLDLIQSSCW